MKDKRIQVRVTAKEALALKVLAADYENTPSGFLRELLKDRVHQLQITKGMSYVNALDAIIGGRRRW